MKKTYTILIIMLCVLAGCSNDLLETPLTPEQQSLIGRAVNFEPYVELFKTTRVAQSYDHLGGFNANDMMYMYRQYQENGEWVYKTPPGTIYKYTELTNGETGIFEKTSWKVYEGKMFNFTDNSYINPDDGTHNYSKKLTKGDSITWESGVTVRFRAWVLSKLGNDLSDKDVTGGKEKTVNYPDYMVCDWVTVSGPTNSIPMAMRHLGCRLGFSPRENNQFARIEITYDPDDYRREDNADTNEHDAADKNITENGTILTAEQAAANVKAAYESMCWPAGVNMDDLSLMACAPGVDQGNIIHGTLTPDEIATQTRRPDFKSSVDSRLYMVTIPYDMSNGPNKEKPIVLPSYTRFRIWLHDVNNGDGQHETASNPNSGAPGASENHYHIFSLADAKINDTNVQAFPNGITLQSGHSYLFTVGYNYKTLEVYAEDNFSWAEQDLGLTEKATDRVETKPLAQNYAWWANAIAAACAGTKTGTQYEPKFQISNETELQEFINLVNGNFNTSGTYNGETLSKAVTITYDPLNKTKELSRTVRWYVGIGENGDGSPDTLWVDKALLEADGYIFYDKYTPSIADRSAIIEEDYLKGPYTFYDEQVRRRLTVTLTDNIDLKDWKLEPIGKDEAHPFAGYFDGDGHLLKNVYMGFTSGAPVFGDGSTLFGYVKDGTVANLCLESTHPLSVTNKLENGRIVGCSVIAPSTQATLASTTSGFCSFVGCFHQGNSTAPLVDHADKFEMYGCMQAASGISGAALANVASAYNPLSEANFIFCLREDLPLDSVGWTSVSCNYYDTELSTGAKAYSFTNDISLPAANPFHRIQYIRGVPTHIMCAKNNYLADNKTEWMTLSPQRRKEIYGAAPWRAMNFGIFMYNSTVVDEVNKCKMHYENESTTGYSHRYPLLRKDEPLEEQYLNVLQLFN